MQKLTRTANSAMLATVLSHFFCCGLPAVFNVIALFAGIGTLSTIAPWIGWLHHIVHQYEIVLLGFSGAALVFGLVVHWISARRDCGTETCAHEPCAPKKQRSRLILIAVSLLFVINLGSYFWHQAL